MAKQDAKQMPGVAEPPVAWLEDPKETARSLKRFGKSSHYASRNYSKLLEQYPGKFIAILDGKVRETADDLDELLAKMDAAGMPRAETLVDYMDPDPMILIL